jgi:hypothetical protein
MKGDDYLNHFLLPNFHFHVTAAYAILPAAICGLFDMDTEGGLNSIFR